MKLRSALLVITLAVGSIILPAPVHATPTIVAPYSHSTPLHCYTDGYPGAYELECYDGYDRCSIVDVRYATVVSAYTYQGSGASTNFGTIYVSAPYPAYGGTYQGVQVNAAGNNYTRWIEHVYIRMHSGAVYQYLVASNHALAQPYGNAMVLAWSTATPFHLYGRIDQVAVCFNGLSGYAE